MQQPPYDRPPLSTPDGEGPINPHFGDAQNTSGQPGAPLPAELQGLNIGAFCLNWIWAIAHNYWLGLLCFVPFFGVIMQFYMLFKGNEAAWQNRRFDSIAQFKEVQHKWMIWGVAIFAVSCVLSVIGFVILMALGASLMSEGSQSGRPRRFSGASSSSARALTLYKLWLRCQFSFATASGPRPISWRPYSSLRRYCPSRRITPSRECRRFAPSITSPVCRVRAAA